VAGLAGANTEADGEVGLAGPGWSEEDDVLFAGDEVQRAQVRDRLSLQRSGVVVVELLEALAGGEPRGADAPFAAVGFAGGDFALETGGEELLVGPALRAGAFGEPACGVAERRGFERAGEECELAGQVTAGLGRRHQAAPSVRPKAVS
jgi:hypothetical protein